jgi:hypothetical protein
MTNVGGRTTLRLGSEHRRWIILNALIVTAFVNAILNTAIAWATSLGERTVPLVSIPIIQNPGTVTNTLGTLFFLPFVTTLLVTASIGRENRLGRITPFRPGPLYCRVLGRIPSLPLLRAISFGLGCLFLLGPLAAVILFWTDFGSIAQSTFVIYNALLGVSLGLVVTPLIAIAVLADCT